MFSTIISYLKNRQFLPVIVVFCLSIILIVLPVNVKITISRFFISTVYFPFTKLDKFLTDVARAKRNNAELNQRLIQYSMQAARFTEDHYGNIRLRRMLGFDLQIPYRLVPAEIIGLKPGSMVKLLEINAGSDKGVDVNMPVVTSDGIVGKTSGIADNAAVVQLLIDHNCKVSVIDQRTRAMGIVLWQGGKLLKMDNVPIESQVAVGDTIISSGLGGIFPPGLLVGTVVYAHDKEGTLFKDIMIKPSVDFSSLEEVFVVIYGE